jgi:hypothetical protein
VLSRDGARALRLGRRRRWSWTWKGTERGRRDEPGSGLGVDGGGRLGEIRAAAARRPRSKPEAASVPY